MFEYQRRIISHFEDLFKGQEKTISQAASWMAESLIQDRLIHTFGTGHSHMIGLEMFARAGGLANVNALLDSSVTTIEGARRGAEIERIEGMAKIIWDRYVISEGDLMILISNSGRNAVPIEMAQHAKEHGVRTIAITSLTQSKKYPSRHSSGKKLYDLVDLVIDNRVPSGDGLMKVDGHLTGPPSSLSGMLIVNTLASEAMMMAAASGVSLPVFFSQNIDGYSNEELYAMFENRIKHL